MLSERFDVAPLLVELHRNPWVWNQIPYRTYAESPHREIDDVWVRYRTILDWDGGAHFNDEHQSVWYPVCDYLPSARLMAIDLANRLSAEQIGGVIITRVPAGKRVYPHADPGWHARYYEKFIIQIASSPGQYFCFENAKLDAAPGECYWFDNAFKHWVVNPTEKDRISLIVCLRRPTCH